jgi:hypothetical protein
MGTRKWASAVSAFGDLSGTVSHTGVGKDACPNYVFPAYLSEIRTSNGDS